MIVGYARTSTLEQEAGFESQLKELEAQNVEKVFKEQVSSVAQRDELEKVLDFVREGDTLIVTKLDRLARDVRHMFAIVDYLKEKKVNLKILDMGLDLNTPTGKMTLNVMASIAEFEREIMLERQKEGIEKAKRAGKYKNRPKRFSLEAFKQLVNDGMRPVEIVEKTGMSRTHYYRLKKQLEAERLNETAS